MTTPSDVAFYFDPACPWTWMTSRWLVDAAAQAGTAIEWRSLSLAVINRGKEVPEQFRAARDASVRVHRVMASLRAAGRNDLIGALYTEYGRRTFHDDEPRSPQLVQAVAEAVGAGAWAAAADDESLDAAVEASTVEACELAGPDVGSPVLAWGEPRRGTFGPIVSPPPAGADALALLEHVVALRDIPGVYEVKRGRRAGPEFGPRP
jgi:hypothetical protein